MHESGPMLNDIQEKIILLTNTMDAFITFASYFLLFREFQQPCQKYVYTSMVTYITYRIKYLKIIAYVILKYIELCESVTE